MKRFPCLDKNEEQGFVKQNEIYFILFFRLYFAVHILTYLGCYWQADYTTFTFLTDISSFDCALSAVIFDSAYLI